MHLKGLILSSNKKDKVERDNGFLVGIALGALLTFVLICVAESFILYQKGWVYNYQSLLGGSFTLIAAFIAYFAGAKQFAHHKETVLREEKAFIKILKEEAFLVEEKLSKFIDCSHNIVSSDVQKYGFGSAQSTDVINEIKYIDNIDSDFKFSIPRSFYDYAILSKLGQSEITKVIEVRHALEIILAKHFKLRTSAVAGKYIEGVDIEDMKEDFISAKKKYEKFFGFANRFPIIDIKIPPMFDFDGIIKAVFSKKK